MRQASATVLQPDLFAPKGPGVRPAPPSKSQSQRTKPRHHRTEAGDRCDGAVQIPGLGHSLCDRCGEWIATKHF